MDLFSQLESERSELFDKTWLATMNAAQLAKGVPLLETRRPASPLTAGTPLQLQAVLPSSGSPFQVEISATAEKTRPESVLRTDLVTSTPPTTGKSANTVRESSGSVKEGLVPFVAMASNSAGKDSLMVIINT